MPFTKEVVGDVLRRAFIGAAGGLRDEDRQKAQELAPLLDETARGLKKRGAVHVVDACAGKSAFGVVFAELVLKPRGEPFAVTALERDAGRARTFAHAIATLGLADQVHLVEGDVADRALWPSQPDLVVALHACGAATDAVIDGAAAARARRLLVVPCCYGAAPPLEGHPAPARVVPGQALADQVAQRLPLPDQALVRRRLACALVDAERTLRLEAAGYRVEVIELFSPTVSPYHLAWRAVWAGEPVAQARAAARLRALAQAGDS